MANANVGFGSGLTRLNRSNESVETFSAGSIGMGPRMAAELLHEHPLSKTIDTLKDIAGRNLPAGELKALRLGLGEARMLAVSAGDERTLALIAQVEGALADKASFDRLNSAEKMHTTGEINTDRARELAGRMEGLVVQNASSLMRSSALRANVDMDNGVTGFLRDLFSRSPE